MAKSITFRESIRLEQVSPDEFVSVHNPGKLGNVADIAYGGCTLSIAIAAAYQTVGTGYTLYTALGNYLGPALTTKQYRVKVKRIRDTRTFATRLVEVMQDFDNGPRQCVFTTLDFKTVEPENMLSYSAPPTKKWTGPETGLHMDDVADDLVKQGKYSAKAAKIRHELFALMDRWFEFRSLPDAVSTQNLMGMAPKFPTSQDGLPTDEKASADWTRCRDVLETEAEHFAALTWYIDSMLSFVPLVHAGRGFMEAKAFASLDFALRFMTPDIDFTKFHLRELKAVHAGDGRTYTEGRLWDENGKIVATMSQQSILRPVVKKEKGEKIAKKEKSSL